MQKLLFTTSTVILTTLIAISSAMAAQQVFRWVDEDGVVHFGDRLPEGIEAEVITVKPNTVQSVQAEQPLAERAVDETTETDEEAPVLSLAEQRRQDRADSRSKRAEEARILAANCATMQRQKDFIEPSPRVLVDDGNGGTRRLEDSERQQMLNESNSYLAANCK